MGCASRGRAAAVLAAAAGTLLAGCGGPAGPAPGPSPRAVRQVLDPSAPAPPAAPGPCRYDRLTAPAARRLTSGTPEGTWSARVPLVNKGPGPCVLKGFPALVALAGQGSPQRNRPLRATPEGTARPVLLAVGGRAWVRLTFHQVLGEGDGYCPSGATPRTAPSLVLGVAGGRLQVGMEDGSDIAECDDTVRTTAFLAVSP
ncbi:DUF4232 domain-containing protein [Streptomyces sp. NPDC001380]|uniref:DUF4232 domain-containing protein n=1 Tax=Streptomyces sp. NPDC001380 TaxID=3364566 RepID=UPI0036B1462B